MHVAHTCTHLVLLLAHIVLINYVPFDECLHVHIYIALFEVWYTPERKTCGHLVYMHRHTWQCLHACVFVAWAQFQSYVHMTPVIPIPSSWLIHSDQPFSSQAMADPQIPSLARGLPCLHVLLAS